MRSFNKKDIQKILSKAAELEVARNLDDQADQLTEHELLKLAQETGISSESIKTALHSFDAPEFEKTFNWFKGTSRLQHLEEFDVPLESEHTAKVLRLLQSMENELGETELHPKKLDWSSQREIESLKVSLFEENGKTSFTYSSDWTPIKFVMGIFPFLMMFVITLVVTKGMGYDKFTSLLFAPIGGLIGFGASWMYLKQRFEKQKERLNTTLEEIRNLFLGGSPEKEFIQIDEEISDEGQIKNDHNKIRA